MDKLLELLFRNPIVMFLVGAWLIGMITNVVKAKRAAAERREARERRGANPLPAQRSQTRSDQAATAATQAPLRAPDQQAPIAQRRTFPQPGGAQSVGTQTAGTQVQPAGPQQIPPQQAAEEIAAQMRRVLGLEPDPPRSPSRRPSTPPQVRVEQRPPASPPPTPAERARRVDPHVGEGIRDRHLARSKVGRTRKAGYRMGNLGGRVADRGLRAAGHGSRYSLDDLRKAIVLNEILSPPVSLRDYDERRPT